MAQATVSTAAESLPRQGVRHRVRDRAKYIFIGPAVLWILLFTLFPLVYALYTSLHGFRSGRMTAFVGWSNFQRLLTDDGLHSAIRITVVYVLVVVAIEMGLGFGLALLFNRQMRGIGFLRTIMTLPLFASPIAIGFLGLTIFYEINGPMNELIAALGGSPVPWLSTAFWARIAVMIIDIWQWTPFVFLVALAGLQSLPQDVLEASQVDGASSWQTLRSIILPMMAPILWLILMLRTIDAFKVVDVVVAMTQGGPGRATEFMSFYIFRTARRFFDYGGAAAQGFLLLFIVMLLVTLLWGRIRQSYEPVG
ncbi:MAG: sugar ABC transporter permease [Chloroflexota bacterium]|nr:sugar ABC transporter permease [Chloroflexota bacterium]